VTGGGQDLAGAIDGAYQAARPRSLRRDALPDGTIGRKGLVRAGGRII